MLNYQGGACCLPRALPSIWREPGQLLKLQECSPDVTPRNYLKFGVGLVFHGLQIEFKAAVLIP